MKTIKIKNKTIYNIFYDTNFNNLYDYIKNNFSSDIKICIITDDNVGRIYLNEFKKNINNTTYIYTLRPGEKNKNFVEYIRINEFLLDNEFNRSDIVVALGGGVVGDISGFVASTYMRGIKYIQVPTTLLSQVDSSVGGKTAINLNSFKNIIGSFYNPILVYININTLNTLDKKNILSGFSEIIKSALIYDYDFFQKLLDIRYNNIDINIIMRANIIKKYFVENDFNEKGMRKILNFGHTFGHAVESIYSDYLSHGECVAIGMKFITYLSLKRGYINSDTNYTIQKKLNELLFNSISINLDIDKIINNLKYDKKNTSNGIDWILLKDIGNTIIENNIKNEEIKDAAKYTIKDINDQIVNNTNDIRTYTH